LRDNIKQCPAIRDGLSIDICSVEYLIESMLFGMRINQILKKVGWQGIGAIVNQAGQSAHLTSMLGPLNYAIIGQNAIKPRWAFGVSISGA